MKRMQQTNTTHNEKVVHVVYSSDAFKEMEILEYGTDGLAEEPSNLSIFGEKTLESSITQTVKVLSLVMKVSQMNINQEPISQNPYLFTYP